MMLYLEYHPLNLTVFMGDFNAHTGTDTETWKDVIGRHGDLEKAYDRIPRARDKLWMVLPEYGIDGQLLLVINAAFTHAGMTTRCRTERS